MKTAVGFAGDANEVVRDDKKPLIEKFFTTVCTVLQILLLVGMALSFTLVGLLSVLVKLGVWVPTLYYITLRKLK